MLVNKHMINDYKIVDIILWTSSLAIAVFSLIYSILSYHFSNKSTNLIKEHLEKTWVLSEANKLFFKNMVQLKKTNSFIIKFLKNTEELTYAKYNFNSTGTRLELIHFETLDLFRTTRFKDITNIYEETRINFDLDFKRAVDIEKIIANENLVMLENERKKLIQYHENLIFFINKILKIYAELNVRIEENANKKGKKK
ncbi:MAG: hypothetical protein ACRCRZ_02500 [Metamycoplasmataceae bacterium]